MNKCMKLIALVLALVLTIQVVPAQAHAAARDMSRTETSATHVETEMIPIEPVAGSELSFRGGPDVRLAKSTPRYLIDREYNVIPTALDFPESPAEDFSYSTTTVDGESVIRITGYRGSDANVRIPQTIDGKPVWIIGSGAFYGKTVIEQLIIPEGVTKMEGSAGNYGAFQGLKNLKSVSLPSTLTNIGAYAFHGCAVLTEVTIPEAVTTIGEYAFDGCTALTTAIIYAATSTIGYDAFNYCNALTIYTIPDSPVWLYAEENNIPVRDLRETMKRVSLSVVDASGTALEEGYTVSWYETGSDAVIGIGNILYSETQEGAVYAYDIQLEEPLLYSYREPPVTEATAVEVTHELEPIGKIQVSGRVTDGTGNAIARADIVFTLTYAEGCSREVSVTTDPDGYFRAELDAVQAEAAFSAEHHFDRTIVVDLEHEDGSFDMGDVVLNRLPSNKIALMLMQRSAHETGGGLTTTINGARLDFHIRNLTSGEPVTELAYEAGWLYTGADQVRPGDRIEITVEDPDGMLSPGTVTMTLDGNAGGSAELTLDERGSIIIDGITGADRASVMLFAPDGKLIDSSSVTGGHTFSHLEAGSYTVVLIADNAYLQTVEELDVLQKLGLEADRDYAVVTESVEDGLICGVGTIPVPALDEEALFLTEEENTFVSLSRSSVYPDEYVMLTVRYKIDPQYDTADEQVIVSLPAGVEMYPYAFDLNNDPITCAYEDGSYVFDTQTDEGIVRLYVRGTELGTNPIQTYLKLQHNGVPVTQPIGTAELELVIGEIIAPEKTHLSTITVRGTTIENSTVEIYVNSELVVTTQANSAGSWSAKVPLDPRRSRHTAT